jgi:hypothetical protein
MKQFTLEEMHEVKRLYENSLLGTFIREYFNNRIIAIEQQTTKEIHGEGSRDVSIEDIRHIQGRLAELVDSKRILEQEALRDLK